MNSFLALVILVCMALVIESADATYEIKTKTAGVENALEIRCNEEGTVVTVLDAWFGNSEKCTKAIAIDPTVDGRSLCCRNVMNEMEPLMSQSEDYYGSDSKHILVVWVSYDGMGGNDCHGVEKTLWVNYSCDDETV